MPRMDRRLPAMLAQALRGLLRALRAPVVGLLALLIVFEEWGWEPLQRAFARLTGLPLLRRVEAAIAGLPPAAAVAVFLLPTLLLLPAKLVALWLIGRGHALLGLGAVVFAKLFGTALVARLFALTRPALLQLAWFASVYARWTAWKDPLLLRLRASLPWRLGRAFKQRLRERWARWRAMLFGA
jgi:hypothetical protein